MMPLAKEIMKYDPTQVTFDDTPLAVQEHLVKMAKWIALHTAGVAVNKLLATIGEEQEVMAYLSDMIIEIYAMESGLLRALKYINMKGEKKAEFHIAAVKVYVNDALPKILHWAKQALAFCRRRRRIGRAFPHR